jgi:hypothetical protein
LQEVKPLAECVMQRAVKKIDNRYRHALNRRYRLLPVVLTTGRLMTASMSFAAPA